MSGIHGDDGVGSDVREIVDDPVIHAVEQLGLDIERDVVVRMQIDREQQIAEHLQHLDVVNPKELLGVQPLIDSHFHHDLAHFRAHFAVDRAFHFFDAQHDPDYFRDRSHIAQPVVAIVENLRDPLAALVQRVESRSLRIGRRQNAVIGNHIRGYFRKTLGLDVSASHGQEQR